MFALYLNSTCWKSRVGAGLSIIASISTVGILALMPGSWALAPEPSVSQGMAQLYWLQSKRGVFWRCCFETQLLMSGSGWNTFKCTNSWRWCEQCCDSSLRTPVPRLAVFWFLLGIFLGLISYSLFPKDPRPLMARESSVGFALVQLISFGIDLIILLCRKGNSTTCQFSNFLPSISWKVCSTISKQLHCSSGNSLTSWKLHWPNSGEL